MRTKFVVQLHDATTLHFDLRLQFGDVFRSWAVPKGPSLDPATRRLAIPVEDHALTAGEFEGVRRGSIRGSGAVIIWDQGTLTIKQDLPTHLSFELFGSKLQGVFALTKTGEKRWVLVKGRDAHARRIPTSSESSPQVSDQAELGNRLPLWATIREINLA
jgi:DNA ligase D-like protein (predicted 3'-phosphoesterase)